MVVEKSIGNIADFPIGNRKIDKVFVEWYELEKKLMRKNSEAGVEVGLKLESHLHEGDVIFADENTVMVIDILPAELTVIPVSTMQEMGRLCFELGNRHLSLAITENQVSVPYDEPTFLYLEKKGFAPKKELKKFSHFTVCHGHSHGDEAHAHSHHHEHIAEHHHTHEE